MSTLSKIDEMEEMEADRKAKDGRSADSPGGLRSENHLTLTTYEAIALLDGREEKGDKPGIIGLWAFADMMSKMWRGSLGGDPFADWWMIKVDEAIERSSKEIRIMTEELKKEMEEDESLECGAPYSVKPVKKVLTFTNNFSFRGARLLGAYDRLVRLIRNARHTGLKNNSEAHALKRKGGKSVRRVFSSATGYRFMGINRDDVILKTARGIEAQKLMGEVPEEILTGGVRSPWAPVVASKKKFYEVPLVGMKKAQGSGRSSTRKAK